MVATAIAAIGATAAVAGTVQANKARKEQARLQGQQQALQARRSRRQAIRQTQLARAQAIASAQSAGGLGGSGASGGIGSLSSQLGTGLGYSTQMSGLSKGISAASLSESRASGIANIGGTLFGVGTSLGGLDPLKNLDFGLGRQTPNKAPMSMPGFMGAS